MPKMITLVRSYYHLFSFSEVYPAVGHKRHMPPGEKSSHGGLNGRADTKTSLSVVIKDILPHPSDVLSLMKLLLPHLNPLSVPDKENGHDSY